MPRTSPVAARAAAQPAGRGAAHATAQAAGTALPDVVDPLPLPARGWGLVEARLAVEEARLALPLPAGQGRPVSALTTVVLQLGDLAVKVHPPGTDPQHLARCSAALAGSATAALPVAGPVVTSHGVVTATPWLVSAGRAGWGAVGSALRRFHDDHARADLPGWVPLRRLPGQLAALPVEAAEVLAAARTALLAEVACLVPPLGEGAVHGDVSPGNVVRTSAGVRLVDLDFVARGPLEYDLASAARRRDSGELGRREYLAFCRAYGYDVRSWEGLPVLHAVAELGGVAFALWEGALDRRGPAWLDQVVERWRSPLP